MPAGVLGVFGQLLETAASVLEEADLAKQEMESEGRTTTMMKAGEAHTLNSPAYVRWLNATRLYRQLCSDFGILEPAEAEKPKEQYL